MAGWDSDSALGVAAKEVVDLLSPWHSCEHQLRTTLNGPRSATKRAFGDTGHRNQSGRSSAVSARVRSQWRSRRATNPRTIRQLAPAPMEGPADFPSDGPAGSEKRLRPSQKKPSERGVREPSRLTAVKHDSPARSSLV